MDNELRWHGKVLSPEFTEARVIVLSDLHYGNPFCSLKHFQRTIDFIKKNDNCFCFLNGDLCESVTKNSKGDVYTQTYTPQEQRDAVIDLMTPIKNKVLGCTTGNHEARIYNETGVDLTKDIAEALQVQYRSEGMMFKLSLGQGNSRHSTSPYVFWSYITHGYGGARTKASKAIKVERAASWIHADWYAMSHDHVVNIAPNIYLMADNRGTPAENNFITGKVTAKRSMLVKTNAFIKWGGYSESGGFPPSDLATPVINLLTPASPQWELYPEKPRQGVKVSV